MNLDLRSPRPTDRATSSTVSSTRRVGVLVGLFVVVAIGPIVGSKTAQPTSRYALTAAMAEHGTADLGRYRDQLGIDRAIYRGHLRSDKAPGQPMLAVPVYLAGRAAGAESATYARARGDLGVWWVTLWSAAVPFAILVALMYMAAERFARRRAALAAALALGVCTMMLPHAVNLYAHDLAALLAFGAWLLIEPVPVSPRRAVLAGFVAGLAVLTEYESVIVLVVLGAYLLLRARHRLGWFLVGGVVPVVVLAWYQWAAFGAPWHTPAAYYAGTLNGTSEGGYSLPGLHGTFALLFGVRGLVFGAPVAFVALLGVVWSIRSGSRLERTHALIALAVFVPYAALCAGWSGLPLPEETGPRYLIPVLPFLAVPLAAHWDRLWRPAALAAAVGALVAVPAATTFNLLRINQSPFPEMFRRVQHRLFLPTLWSMGLGRLGVALYAASVVGAGVLLLRASAGARRDGGVLARTTDENR